MGQPKLTTPLPKPSSRFVKIIHPYHPRCGETVEVVRTIHSEPEPDFIIRLADGLHAAIAMSWTDAGDPMSVIPVDNPPLLDLAGLRHMVDLVKHFKE